MDESAVQPFDMPKQPTGRPNGVRLNPRQDERARAAIQTDALLKRLNAFALNAEDPRTRQPVDMTDTQVRAALGLLRKTIPDLAVTTIQGDPDRPVQFVIRGPNPVESVDDWLKQHAPPMIEGETTEG